MGNREKAGLSKRGMSCRRLPQTKILERLTKEEIRISKEALLKGVSTRFGLRTIEKSIENLDLLFCQSFQNLRLEGVHLRDLPTQDWAAFNLGKPINEDNILPSMHDASLSPFPIQRV